MTFLPIVQRELYVASRRKWTFWARLFAAMIALGIVAVELGMDARFQLAATWGSGTTAAIGAMLFRTLAYVAFYGCLFAGILLTADCVSSERREDTLGLLFLTDLHGYDVVLGKLVSRSLMAVYCLFAIVPVAALPLLWGGVSYAEVGRVTLVLLNTLFLSLAVGILVSSFCREFQNALALAELAVLLLAGAGPLAGVCLARNPVSQGLGQVMEWTSPVLLLSGAFDSASGATKPWFSAAFTFQVGLTLLCLILASWRLPHCWQTKPGRRIWEWPQQVWARLKYGSPGRRLARRRTLLDPNPLCWLGSRDRMLSPCMWITAFLLVGIALMMNLTGSPWFQPNLAIGSLFFIHGIIKVIVASDAVNRFGDLRRSQMLPVIWSTRLSVADIVEGQLQAMRRVFRGPVVLALAYDLFWLIMIYRDALPDQRLQAMFQGICVSGIFLWDIHAVARVGLWRGMRSRFPQNAAYTTLLVVLGLPWLFVLALSLVLQSSMDGWLLAVAWTVSSGLTNLYLTAWAASRLENQFHRQVQDPLKSVKPAPNAAGPV